MRYPSRFNHKIPADLGTKSVSTSRIKLLLNLLSFRDNQQEVGAAERMGAEQKPAVRKVSRAARNRFNWLATSALTSVADGLPKQDEGLRKKFESEPPFAEMIGATLAVTRIMSLLVTVFAVVVYLYLKLQHSQDLVKHSKKREEEEDEEEEEEETKQKGKMRKRKKSQRKAKL